MTKHSMLYYKLLLEHFTGGNILDYLNGKQSFIKFTKADIFNLVRKGSYSNDFSHFLLEHIESIFSLFTKEEYVHLMKIVEDALKEKMLDYLIQHISTTKEYWNIILSTLELDKLVNDNADKILDKIWEKPDLSLLVYLSVRVVFYYLRFDENKYYDYMVNKVLYQKEPMEKLLSSFSNIPCFDFCKYLDIAKKSPYFFELFEKYKEEFYWSLYQKGKVYTEEQKREYHALILLMDDLVSRSNTKVFEIGKWTCGGYSNIFQFSSFVLKVGDRRELIDIDNSENLLYPCARFYLKELDLFVEITAFCEMGTCTIDDVYAIYKAERKKGRVWLDPKRENVGRLLVRNDPSEMYGFYVAPESISFKGSNNIRKEAGEFVIVDTDLLCSPNEVFWRFVMGPSNINLYYYYVMEKRYQEERQLELEKKRR